MHAMPRAGTMAPRLRAPPALMDELVEEILLRVPPSDPATLVRAGLVCKPWRRIILSNSDDHGGFLRRYRERHHHGRTQPLLGFLHSGTFRSLRIHSFVSLAAARPSPFSQPWFGGDSSYSWRALDCRHGLALIQTDDGGLVVWDPVTGDKHHLSPPPYPYKSSAGAVLCAADGCDHLACRRGGAFAVVFVGSTDHETWACVTSSSSEPHGKWSEAASIIHFTSFMDLGSLLGATQRSLLAGDELYFTVKDGRRILKYNLKSHRLSVIKLPALNMQSMVLVTMEGGDDGEQQLGIAGVKDCSLHLWSPQASCNANNNVSATWTRRRVIDLQIMLPDVPIIRQTCRMGIRPRFGVLAFAEGADIVFISTDAGVFTFELKSGQFKKVFKRTSATTIFPYVGFLHSRLYI